MIKIVEFACYIIVCAMFFYTPPEYMKLWWVKILFIVFVVAGNLLNYVEGLDKGREIYDVR